ncbi:MAG TPA: PhzF family phenazine biosynthesis protein [Ktedonobacterales bacterium]
MRRIRFTQLDVFTSEPFSGNQLAVFFDAAHLAAGEMQAIAREMNFSESVFILAAADPLATARLRIFTPGVELPFAGHPVIGATFALAAAGRITPDSTSPITLETGVGPLAIELLFADARLSFAWMSQPTPTFEPWSGDRAALASSFGLAESDLRADLPIERGSAGVPFIYIPLASQRALDQAQPGPGMGAALHDAMPITGAYLFVPPGQDNQQPVAARMFAHEVGIVEDAATGSAAGPFGAYLVRHGLAPLDDGLARVTVAQGVQMGRASRLFVTVEQRDGAVSQVRVGGESVVVAHGDFLLPDQPIGPTA